jgi:hypothetical protein
MIKPLRKRHLQIWIALAVLIPFGIIVAWVSIPQEAKDKLLQLSSAHILPNVLASLETDNYTVHIRGNNDTSQLQLEWINKKTLSYPTATIYEMLIHETDIKHGKLIGRIEARGSYYFKIDSTFKPINDSPYKLLLYDFIHKQNIDSINF